MNEDDNKKHVITGFLPVTALYLLFVMTVSRLIQVTRYVVTIGLISHGMEYGLQVSLTFLQLAAHILSILSIAQVMRDKPYSVSCLKFTLWYQLFICAYVDDPDLMFMTSAEIFGFGWIIIKSIFCISFLVYLYRSKRIKRDFPKNSRKMGPWGWIWITGWCMTVGIFGASMAILMDKKNRSEAQEINRIALKQNEYSEGYLVLHSEKAWKLIRSSLKEVNMSNDEDTQFGKDALCLEDSCMRAEISTIVSIDEATRRIFNRRIFRFCPYDETEIRAEVASLDTLLSGHELLSNTYSIEKDSIVTYWTFAALYDKETFKSANLSLSSKDRDRLKDTMLNILSNISFSLEVMK